MRISSPQPLRRIVTRYVATAVGLPFVFMVILGAFWLVPQTKRNLDVNQQQLAVAVSTQVESYLSNARDLISSIASACTDSSTPSELARIQKVLDENVRMLGRLKACYLLDKSGRIIAVSVAGGGPYQKDLLGTDLSHNPLYITSSKERKQEWSNTYLSIVGGGISVAQAVPLGDRVFIGELELDRLSNYLDRIGILKSQRIFVLDSNGQVVADRKGSYTAQQLNLSSIDLVRTGAERHAPQTGSFDFEGEQMAGSLYQVPQTGWSVLVAQPLQEANRQLVTTVNIVGLGLMAALLLAGSLSMPFTRKLVRLFELLAEHARSVEANKDPVPWPQTQIREFNNLAESLQRMSGALQERARLLEDEVRERLKVEEELRRKNEDLGMIEEELRCQVEELFQAQSDLKKSEEAYRMVADWTYDWEYWLSPERKFLYISPSCERITGYRVQEFLSEPALLERIIEPEYREMMLAHLEGCSTLGLDTLEELCRFEFKLRTRAGESVWIEHTCRAVYSRDGRYLGRRACNRDVTERRTLEQQVHQQQKLEGIGLLAGGIAHDFNNMLLPILICGEALRDQHKEDATSCNRAAMIVDAATKAKDLVRQLLTFSRNQELQVQYHDLNRVVEGFSGILRRTIREDIELVERLSGAPCPVLADRVQIEQILLNLAVNAMDAIGGNGSIALETGQVIFDEEYCNLHPGSLPGRYVMLSLGDSGCGMSDATLAHIFEPFFTTKPVGHGTGLGLSTTYGIVKQHGGSIDVHSEPGKGTTFKIYLPLAQPQDAASPQPEKPAAVSPASATILVVEDNQMVLEMVREVLLGAGYTVLSTSLPEEALELLRCHEGQVDLLLSDVVMPQMSGPELHERLQEILPGLRALYMSGYASSSVVHKGYLREGANYLCKPFTSAALLAQIEDSLAAVRSDSSEKRW